jgi:hypothetical protein
MMSRGLVSLMNAATTSSYSSSRPETFRPREMQRNLFCGLVCLRHVETPFPAFAGNVDPWPQCEVGPLLRTTLEDATTNTQNNVSDLKTAVGRQPRDEGSGQRNETRMPSRMSAHRPLVRTKPRGIAALVGELNGGGSRPASSIMKLHSSTVAVIQRHNTRSTLNLVPKSVSSLLSEIELRPSPFSSIGNCWRFHSSPFWAGSGGTLRP